MRKVFGRPYLFQKRIWALLTGFIDLIGYLLRSPSDSKPLNDVKKILVSRIDHLGDVFIALSILPHIKKAFPYARVDFLAGKWSTELLKANPCISNILIYNSFVHNRTGSLLSRLKGDIKSFVSVAKEVKKEKYDLGIDLRAYPFNSILLMYLGGVKYKTGFSTGGLGFLLDSVVPYREGVHETEHVGDVLGELGITVKKDAICPLFSISGMDEREAEDVLCNLGLDIEERFILLHSGAGRPKKQWSMDRWQELIDGIRSRCSAKILVYDDKNILTRCCKLPDKLSLGAFAGIVEKTMLFIGHDSFPAHLAASLDIPTITIWSGINDHIKWQPCGDRVYLVRKDVECSPCYRGGGCQTMECMDIKVEEVLDKVSEVLKECI